MYIRNLILVLIFFVLAASTKVAGQLPLAPEDYELKQFSIQDKELGTIRFYIDTVGLKNKAPIFIDANGSGGIPLCLYVKTAGGHSIIFNPFSPPLIDRTKEKFHHVILGKPGIPFCDSITTQKSLQDIDMISMFASYTPAPEYTRRLDLQWRINATKKVVTYLIEHGYWDKTKIVAYGYSEGAHMVPSLAVSDKRVTHVVAVVGIGLNQFYDRLVNWRVKAKKGILTEQQAQDSINSYLETVQDIYAHPHDTQRMYEGHSYKRWASFCSVIPMEQMEKLNIPIYMIAATADENSLIYGLDYVPLEFARLGKKNLTYTTCVGCDHGLTSWEHEEPVHHFDDVTDKIIKWIDEH